MHKNIQNVVVRVLIVLTALLSLPATLVTTKTVQASTCVGLCEPDVNYVNNGNNNFTVKANESLMYNACSYDNNNGLDEAYVSENISSSFGIYFFGTQDPGNTHTAYEPDISMPYAPGHTDGWTYCGFPATPTVPTWAGTSERTFNIPSGESGFFVGFFTHVTRWERHQGEYVPQQDEDQFVIVLQYTGPTPNLSCTFLQATQRIYQGDSVAYSFKVDTDKPGFSSPVALSASIRPASSGNQVSPSVSIDPSYNNKVPPTTGVLLVNAPDNTTPNDKYVITMTATGGGQTKTCITNLDVKEWNPDFQLRIEPDQKMVNAGQIEEYEVFADCTGSFDGDITGLKVQSTFVNPIIELGATTLHCGRTTTVSIDTSSIPEDQRSNLATPTYQNLTVTGSANL